MDVANVNIFLLESDKSIKEKLSELGTIFPTAAGSALVSSQEVCAMALIGYVQCVIQTYFDGINYIEDMIRTQLRDAIGKFVGPIEFQQYMAFHYRKLFKPSYAPSPFCFSIRRSEHHVPEGIIKIEQVGVDEENACVQTISHCVSESRGKQMQLALSSETQVTFGGRRFVHALLMHKFATNNTIRLNLIARTRQFSSFILLVGRLPSKTVFDPKFGIIVQNKDLLQIPLDLEEIPTPKAFADAIESLSPEQQRFAKAFRSMQLESTMFGICVIHIKPQLEKLLKLAPDSLTKEIRLTQDLNELFIKYQIPADLLSFEGDVSAISPESRLEFVKQHVKNMHLMIKSKEEDEIQQKKKQDAFNNESKGCFSLNNTGFIIPCSAIQQNEIPSDANRSSFFSNVATSSSFASFGASYDGNRFGSEIRNINVASQLERQFHVHSHHIPEAGDMKVMADSPFDFNQIPIELDDKYKKYDLDNAIYPAIIKMNNDVPWPHHSQQTLLGARKEGSLANAAARDTTKSAAFDLLDALSKSGALNIDQADLHVVIAATHVFDKSVLETVIQNNINPIEKVERSMLLMASTIHACAPEQLIAVDQLDRVKKFSSHIF
jgi:hypothetical protein